MLVLLLATHLPAAAQSDLYARIDAIATNGPPAALTTPQALAEYLASQARDEREKARVW